GSELGLERHPEHPAGAVTDLGRRHVPTRLERLDETTPQRPIKRGHAVCDAAVRRHVSPGLPAPAGFPHPDTAVQRGPVSTTPS
ncbi:MAG: hypothetical protein JXB32_03910, partial [Deltaproteobacteria bacterium]|nr:hypothetical protein [Deltaproteobacteria bacterium]